MPIDPDLAERMARAAEVARGAQPVTRERDALIREAHEQGGGMREIGRIVGLSHEAVRKIVAKS